MKGVQPPVTAVVVQSWWTAVLAGQVDDPHPVYGPDVDVAFHGGVLRLSGELPSAKDRQNLLDEAHAYVGRGIESVDAKHLRVANHNEKPGVLEQTLIAAFANRDVAEFAARYLVKNRRAEPKQMEVVDAKEESKARQLVPADFMSEVQKAFKAGDAVLVMRIDETSAYRVRELLAEETRSRWTVATPPVPAKGRGR
jgi:hypothetical protein